jgi:hypothetical protein
VPRTQQAYDAFREKQAKISADRSREGRDIGPPPAPLNPERKEKGRSDLRFFLETYFPLTFNLAWSPDHLRIIKTMEQAVLYGGLFALAMPRGSGKTSLAEGAAIWALLYGHRKFVVVIGADEGAAAEILDSIKTDLECNDLLNEDFGEVTYPIRMLEGIAHRCNGQLSDGKNTHMCWTAKEVVLPTIPDSPASGSVLRVAGITGRVRGMKFKTADGKSLRPDFVIPDDPQTDESAKSPSQNDTRVKILKGAILGLAGPGKKISGVMPCTVIAPDDMADRILDRQKHPEWQGERTKLIYKFPTNEQLWEQYRQIRDEDLRAGDNRCRKATAFYKDNRAGMDEGAQPAWPERHTEDELSATQHAMNLLYRMGRAAFFAECQNEAIDERRDDSEQLTAEQIAAKTNGEKQGAVPIGRDHVTAFIDVQGKLLYYIVVAWGKDFTGDVIEYGTYPDQKRTYFAASDARRTLAMSARSAGLEGSIYAGLDKLTKDLFSREWRRRDGAPVPLERCLIDANWGKSTDVVYKFCRQSEYAGRIMPSHGRGIGASSKPWDQYTKREGELLGHHWMLPSVKGKRAVRHVLIDVNFWKSFVHERLQVSIGDAGCLALYGKEKDAARHRLISEHWTAEYSVRTQGQGRSVDEWRSRPGRLDNHWFDCLVGAAVAASMLGCELLRRKPMTPAAQVRKAARKEKKVFYLN